MPVSARYVHPHHCPPRSTSCSGGTVGSRDTSRRGNHGDCDAKRPTHVAMVTAQGVV
jgi:hypothetical protein